MADFLYAHSKTAISEGGYSSDPDDRGNWVDGVLVGTRYGISAPVLRAYLGRAISSSDMKNLPLSTAQDIFRANYWDKVRGDEILSNEAAYQVYDMAVNAGVSAAVKHAGTGTRVREMLRRLSHSRQSFATRYYGHICFTVSVCVPGSDLVHDG